MKRTNNKDNVKLNENEKICSTNEHNEQNENNENRKEGKMQVICP